jgi:pSer/pThr/pTyr-binding forkhead associated (FHA) protein
VEVDATVSPVQEAPAGEDAVDAGTRVFEVPVVKSPDVLIEIREPNQTPRKVPASGAPIRIGRAPECELVLRDSRVSRRHARLAARDGVLVLTDLDSTNGTRVNGHRVSEVVLGAGDRITIGETVLTIEPATAESGARR